MQHNGELYQRLVAGEHEVPKIFACQKLTPSLERLFRSKIEISSTRSDWEFCRKIAIFVLRLSLLFERTTPLIKIKGSANFYLLTYYYYYYYYYTTKIKTNLCSASVSIDFSLEWSNRLFVFPV